MHQSAMLYGERFFETYCPKEISENLSVVEIGSQDVNGSLRDVCPPVRKYVGLDFVEGKGVDLIIEDPYKLPLPDSSVNIVVSSSCFEHSEFFWLVFLEALRVLKNDGVFYLNAPSNGFYHRWPVDCWRFYPDSGHALVSWANRNGYNPLLLESFIGQRSAGTIADGGMWNDFVAVFLKDKGYSEKYADRIVHTLSDFCNAYSNEKGGIINHNELCPDFSLIQSQSRDLYDTTKRNETLQNSIDEKNTEVDNLNQAVQQRDNYILLSEEKISKLEESIIECKEEIDDLNKFLNDRRLEYQSHVVQLEKTVWEHQQKWVLIESEALNLRNQLDVIFKSRSWKLTAPLRKFKELITKISRKFYRNSLSVYRRLPLTFQQRKRIKDGVFGVFGFAFKRWDTYKRWAENSGIREGAFSGDLECGDKIGQISKNNNYLLMPSADGNWEWQDYYRVKSRIAEFKSRTLAEVKAQMLDILDVGHKKYEKAINKINLPRTIDKPEVSIVIPTFNNVKITLECLLSISKWADLSISFEVIIADDASDDCTSTIVSQIPNLRVIRNSQNLGFLRNCNNALAAVNGRYVIFLNNDVQVTKGWMESLYNTFRLFPKVGAVGPKYLYPTGFLQEAGASFRSDGIADMVGLNDDPNKPRYNYARRVDYVSGACLMMPTDLALKLGGFSEEFLPCYCEDSDLCLRIQEAGFYVYYNPDAQIIHHLSKSTASAEHGFKLGAITSSWVTLRQKWQEQLVHISTPKIIAFYLPQFHPFPENELWWGKGFTEWTNVSKAQPNFIGHYQPRLPADLGYYDLRLLNVMQEQAELARRYGIHGFCFYYYWFNGKRLLEFPIEQMLNSREPDMPFCLCWANENWSRRWDGQDQDLLMSQSHSPEDDEAVINDLIRYFEDPRYIRIDKRPIILVYRVTLFPDFSETADRWRRVCREKGIGEIYITMVESFDLVHANSSPSEFGCDAAVEFPPHEMAEPTKPSGDVINPDFIGAVADYRDIAVRFATRDFPGYTRFKGVITGWDNTARRQNNGFCFENSTPGVFQAWLEESIEQTRQQHYRDEQIVFVNAWNEWAEGAYLEPDRRFGHTYLEAVKNAIEASSLISGNKYWYDN